MCVSQQIHRYRYRYTQVQRRRQREGILNKSVSFDSKELAARLLQGSRREGAGGEGRSLVLSLTSTSAALGLAPEYATARSFVPLCWAADTAGVGAASSLSLGGSRRDLSKLGQDCAKGFARAPRGLMHCRESERVPQCVFLCVCVCVWESEARQAEASGEETRHCSLFKPSCQPSRQPAQR